MASGAAAKKSKGPKRSGDGATSTDGGDDAPEATPWWQRGWALVTAGVITLGALASAITAIAGLVWPEPDVLDKAEITSIETFPAVRLSDYARPGATHPSGLSTINGPEEVRQAAFAHPPDAADVTSPSPTPAPPPSPVPTPIPTPVPTPEPTISPSPSFSFSPGPRPKLLLEDVLQEVLELAPQYVLPVQADEVEWVALPILSAVAVDKEGKAVPPEVAARRLVGILGKTRMHQTKRGKLDPLGVVVTANLRLEGFRDERLDVSWRITGRAKGRAPYSRWFTEVPAARVTPSRFSDGGTVEFWVPMPKRPGEYVVQVIIRHHDTQLFAKKSEPFG
jgi:hypothetical protein